MIFSLICCIIKKQLLNPQEEYLMFKNQANGRKNLIGIKMREVRKSRGISQRQVADDLAELGLIVDKNAVQRMESGQRFITDIELITIAKYLEIPVNELIASLTK